MSLSLVIVAAMGCGRFGFDPQVAPDASPIPDDQVAPANPLGICQSDPPTGRLYYVSPTGDDNGEGSATSPWLSITHASDAADDGSTILVRAGTYGEDVHLTRKLVSGITIRSETLYKARIESANTAILCEGCARFTVVGLDLTQAATATFPIVLVTGPDSHRFVLRNNIVHDSIANSGVRISGQAQNAIIEYNVIYNIARSAQLHIAAGSETLARHNILFSNYAPIPTERYFGSIWVETAEMPSSRHRLSGNILFGWQSRPGNSAIFLDRSTDITVENNLIIGDTDQPMRSSFELLGASGIIVRNNTVTGNLLADGYALSLSHQDDDELVEAEFSNNIWSDSSGEMDDFSDTPTASIQSVKLDNNIVWNGAAAVPSDSNDAVNAGDDVNGQRIDPLLPAVTPFTRPVWSPQAGEFAGGHDDFCELFGVLVERFARIDQASPAAGTANAAAAPAIDIVGEQRAAVSIGAREAP